MNRTVKPLTRNELQEELEKYPTKVDLQNELKKFATKDDLNSAIKDLASKDDLITFKDAILHEIAKMRDEVAIVGGQRDMLEDHDQRIETIEKHLHIQSLP